MHSTRPERFVGLHVAAWNPRAHHDAVAVVNVQDGMRSWDIISRELPRGQRKHCLHPELIQSVLAPLFEVLNPIRTVLGIDVALGWPVAFHTLVKGALPLVDVGIGDKSVNNTILYRETDRQVYIDTGLIPASPVSELAGNAASKGQLATQWLRKKYRAYMPPFDTWSTETFCRSTTSIIEVGVEPGLMCASFKRLYSKELRTFNADLKKSLKPVLTRHEELAVCSALIAMDFCHAVCYPSDDAPRWYDVPGVDDREGDEAKPCDQSLAPPKHRRSEQRCNRADPSLYAKEGMAVYPRGRRR